MIEGMKNDAAIQQQKSADLFKKLQDKIWDLEMKKAIHTK